MFLFTTPPSPSRPATGAPVAALRRASESSGVGFDYLLTTAKRESALNPTAKARTSSAQGLFQFVEQTWLGLVRDSGGAHGLAAEAAEIGNSGGRFVVADATSRARILALRNDPGIAADMAAELARRNVEGLSRRLGRAPSDGELYIAHFLGVSGAAALIRGATETPESSAATRFPAAAAANRAIFYDRSGQPRPLGAVYAALTKGFDAAPAPQMEPARAATGGNAFHSLFTSGAASGGARSSGTGPTSGFVPGPMPQRVLSSSRQRG